MRSDLFLTVGRHSSTTGTAAEHARQRVTGAPLLVRLGMATRLLSTLGSVEQFLRDNSQLRRVHGLPVFFGVRTRQAASGWFI